MLPEEVIMPDCRSSNPFVPADQMTMADAFELIESDEELTLQRRRNICSAIRTFAKLIGQDPGFMPAHPGYYRPVLKRLHPEQCGVSKKRLQNIKSDVLFAMRRVGSIGDGRSYLAPLSPAWQALWDHAVHQGHFRYYLSRLMRYCSAHGIPPEDLNDAVSERFLTSLVDESFI